MDSRAAASLDTLTYSAAARDGVGPFLIFLFVSVGAGLLAYYVPGTRSPLAVAILLIVLYVMRDINAKETNANGVDTTATITAAGVDGMVNYVQHQRLTLKFTDDKGVDRWIHVGRTGGGYSIGDTLPLRYNPKYPGRERAIVVGY